MYKHKCAYCGKEYETDTYYSKYCSKTCSDAAEEKRKQDYAETKIRICARCGKPFQVPKLKNGNYSSRKYCSEECMNGYKKSENGYPILICKICGKEFEGKYSNGKPATDIKYCSKECEQVALNNYKDNYQQNKTRVCKNCDKEFIVPRIADGHFSETVYCSDECRFAGRSFAQNKAQKQRETTCLERYGVIYPCLTEQCRTTNEQISNINRKFAELLDKNNIKYKMEFVLEDKAYDFLLLDSNMLIEIDPTYTHTPIGTYYNNYKYNKYFETSQYNKSELANKYNYHCIHIWDWDNWDKILDIIKNKNILYARKLSISEITKTEANVFLEKNHIQGKCKGNEINLSLKHNGQIAQVMTFGKPRYNKHYQWELLRLCTLGGYSVVGGTERLFKYFIDNFKPESIISYCDNSKFNGDVYQRLGFKLKIKHKPQKIWSKGNIRITDNLLRQRGYDQLFKTTYGKGTNNEQLMLNSGWLPIYDCGQSVYEYLFK